MVHGDLELSCGSDSETEQVGVRICGYFNKHCCISFLCVPMHTGLFNNQKTKH